MSTMNARKVNKGRKVTRSPLEVMQSMMQGCCFQKAEPPCKICQVLKAKVNRLSGSEFVTPTEANAFLMEEEQSQALRSQFQTCTNITKSSHYDSAYSGWPSSTLPDIHQQTVDARSLGGPGSRAATEYGASQEDGPPVARGSQKVDDAYDAGDKNISLSYGLHDLIWDVEQNPNHHDVFDGLSQSQLRSLFAQITCKETLIRQDKGADNAAAALRLVRIEQELNDLMAKDEAAKTAAERNLGVGPGC